MGFLNFLGRKQQNSIVAEPAIQAVEQREVNIPRELFLEESQPGNGYTGGQKQNVDIETIYSFLQKDYESEGYKDSMTNPDESYKKDNILLIRQDLHILIQQVSTHYEDLIREIDFHISSRERAGLIDLVEELRIRRRTVEEHMGKVRQISADAENNTGLSQRMVLSYQRGFSKGMAALTQARIFSN